MVIRTSSEPLRVADIPEVNFPPAIRCVLYNESVTLPEGVTATISGLPVGLSASQVGRVLTVSGITSSFAGSQPIVVIIRDARGASFTLDKVFTVNDFDIEIGVL